MARRPRGLTLSELVIALSITSIVGLAVTGAATMLSAGHAHTETEYESLETARSALRAVQKSIRNACLLNCSMGEDGVAYWCGDENGDNQINIGEMRVIAYDSTSGEVRLYWTSFPNEWPDWFRDLMNSSMSLMEASDQGTLDSSLLNHTCVTHRVLASNVASFLICPVGTGPLAEMARMEITVGDDSRPVTMRSAATLRAPGTPYVRDLGGGWYVYDGPDD
jgi:type II secretory pathway pseudopilin PulG